MTPNRNSDTSWAKNTEIYGSAYLAGPYIYINTYKFAVPPILWSPKTKTDFFKTIQKGRRQDSERCFKTGPQYVPKDGFQDFLNTSNRS